MIDALLVFGLGRDELIANAGIAGGVVMTLAVLAMIVVSVLPAYSESWAERLGTTETTPGGPEPSEVIPGRDEPVAAPGAAQSGASEPAASLDEAGSATGREQSTAVPEPETAGAGGSSAEDDSDGS